MNLGYFESSEFLEQECRADVEYFQRMQEMIRRDSVLADPNQINADLVFELVEICNKHGLLGHYRTDLTKIDAKMFNDLSDWNEFIWVVGSTFTHLYPVGLHHRTAKVSRTILNSRANARYFRVRPKHQNRVVEVEKDQALSILDDANPLSLKGNTLFTANGFPMSEVFLEMRWNPDRQRKDCYFAIQSDSSVKDQRVEYWIIEESVSHLGFFGACFADPDLLPESIQAA